ncbi:hypothetical protein BC835DRAFT_472554 [Cytidiella melzeri]|nr:hypothetical protein BC835DRAFT_472554 [Cytidiella melzeri]
MKRERADATCDAQQAATMSVRNHQLYGMVDTAGQGFNCHHIAMRASGCVVLRNMSIREPEVWWLRVCLIIVACCGSIWKMCWPRILPRFHGCLQTSSHCWQNGVMELLDDRVRCGGCIRDAVLGPICLSLLTSNHFLRYILKRPLSALLV